MDKFLDYLFIQGLDYAWFCNTPTTVAQLAADAGVPETVVRDWIDICDEAE